MVQGESGIPDLQYLEITAKLIFTRSELHGGTKLVLLQFAESQPILVILESSRHGVLLKWITTINLQAQRTERAAMQPDYVMPDRISMYFQGQVSNVKAIMPSSTTHIFVHKSLTIAKLS